MSLLDGYSGYNQILVHEDDRDKTVFTTPWGTFHYAKMPFGLKNVGVTFQRTMDMAFANEKDVFLFVYLDGLTVFYNSYKEHLYHSKIFFSGVESMVCHLIRRRVCLRWMREKSLVILSQKMASVLTQLELKLFNKLIFPRTKRRSNPSMVR